LILEMKLYMDVISNARQVAS